MGYRDGTLALTRRDVIRTFSLTVAGIVGLSAMFGTVAADLVVSSFSASDDAIRTVDGTIDAVWATAQFDIAWSPLDADGDLDIVLAVRNPETDATDTLLETSEPLGRTSGSGSVELASRDVLATEAFELVDFAVPEPGESTEADIAFELTVSAAVGDDPLIEGAASTEPTITVDRLAGPSVDAVELTDDSNPSWTCVDVTWAVSDDAVGLAEVTSELRFVGGDEMLDSQTMGVGGSEATGEHLLEVRAMPDEGYAVTVIATNVEGLSPAGMVLDSRDFDDGEPEGSGLASITVEVTGTERRGNVDQSTQVTVSYESEDEKAKMLEVTVEAGNAAESETEMGTSGSVVVDVGAESQPTETPAVSVDDVDGGQFGAELSLEDGIVDLLDD